MNAVGYIAHLQPVRMNCLREDPMWVQAAFPPSATIMADMMAVFPPVEEEGTSRSEFSARNMSHQTSARKQGVTHFHSCQL